MSLKIYAALSAYYKNTNGLVEEGHITLAFMTVKETSKLKINSLLPDSIITVKVKDVEYWEKANVTVLVLEENKDISSIQSSLTSAGFIYEHFEFKPHITISKGNVVNNYKSLKETTVYINDLYLRLKEIKNVK